MPFKANTHKPYPYDIPPPPELDPETFKKLDLWNALEFFRVEALLRSESAQTLYRLVSQRRSKSGCPADRLERWKLLSSHVFKRKGETASTVSSLLRDNTLRDHLFIDDGWLVLWGAHHRYVRPDPWMKPSERFRFEISDGILDLSLLAQEGKLDERTLLHNLHQEQKLFLYLKIKCAIAPETNLKALRPFLHQRHRAVMVHVGKPNIDPSTGEHTVPWHPRKKPPIKDYPAWLKYFQCYDLRKSGLKPEEIAGRVYPKDIDAVEKATQAVKRVKKLIEAAESNDWPPRNIR